MRANPVSFALTVGMGLVVVLIGMTLLNATGLVGFAATHPVEATLPGDSVSANSFYAIDSTALPNATVAVGDALFKGNCAQCHAIHTKEVGPALAGITERRPVSWLIPWGKNSSKVVARGDAYAVKLFNEYGKQQMPSFNLTDDEISSILAYIESEQIRGYVSSQQAIID